MNQYLKILNMILNHAEKKEYTYKTTQDGKIFQCISVSSKSLEEQFKVTYLTIDCENNEIEGILFTNMTFVSRQQILGQLTADEIEPYHKQCKSIIDRAIKSLDEQRTMQKYGF